MKLKSVLAGTMIALMAHGSAMAYDNLWFDRSAGIDRFQKVVVYPMSKGSRDKFFPENKAPYGSYNYELHKRLTRHAKGITYYELFDRIPEKNDTVAMVVKPEVKEKLLGKFASEKDRAAAIQEAFAADGYIVPFFRDRRIQVDHSPAATAEVENYAYTQVEHAPNDKYDGERSYKIDERRWTETVHIPAADLERYITELEFTMFNEDGNKIFTCLNRRHSYNHDFDYQYKDMKDDFADDLKDIKKNKAFLKNYEKNKSSITLGIGNLQLPANVSSDEYMLKSCWYLYKKYAMNMKNAKALEGADIEKARYRVEAVISDYDFEPVWVDPSATSYTEYDSSWEGKKWKDKDGKEHTIKYTKYVPKVVKSYGHYTTSGAARVKAALTLYDVKTKMPVFAKSYYESNDKEVDAWNAILKDFFKNADKEFKKMGKEE